ncbi:HTH-type transcriptional activator RhaR [Paraburkholderia solisilvae]|uniref:HTH-type transcriptional activator RhaR n=2 Tax=Paraburkholderia solisilvae TaxID=624376 RepID=A0A6J5DK38_9BURK|nr:HTH-type transcriptional activator RhaR [Paraburkholderia solisilvae]
MALTYSPDSKEAWRSQGTSVLKCHLNFGHGDPTGSVLRSWRLGDADLIDARFAHMSVSRMREGEDDSLCLKLVRRGVLAVEHGGQVRRFKQGDLILVRGTSSVRQNFIEPAEVVSVLFSPESLKERGLRFDAHGYTVPDHESADVQAIAGMIALVADQNGDTSEKMRRRQGGQLLELLDLLIESPLALSRRRSGEATLFRAKRFIAQNLRNPELDVPLIAAAVHASSSQLTRLFRAEGQTLMRYLLDCRLTLAAELLQQIGVTRLQVGEIAYRCGFSSPTHFSRVFKERYGVSPKEAACASLMTSTDRRLVANQSV